MRRTFGPIINGTDAEARGKPSNDMPGIPQETIDRVLDSTSIVELIGSFVALKKIGQNFPGSLSFSRRQDALAKRQPGEEDLSLLRLRSKRERNHFPEKAQESRFP